MHTKTYKYFNQLTRQALLDHVSGYVDKTKSITQEINRIRGKFGINKVYRFDLGENVDGFSVNIHKLLENLYENEKLFENLNEYPNVSHRSLRNEIAQLHGIYRDQILISTGLDSILDLISRVFFDYKDAYLMPTPDFFLFETYSERMGAMPIFLPLEESNNFCWTEKTVCQFEDSIMRFKPKIAWISNPSNPTGQVIPKNILYELIKIAHSNYVFIVIDEAYGEYIPNGESSAIKYINNYENLMVLRTFSKAYGLAGIRLGYLVSSSKDIINALLMHRQHFPATQIALNMASVALKDQEHIKKNIIKANTRKKVLFKKLSELHTFKFIPSSTNIFMLKNRYLDDEKLHLLLKQKGVYTAKVKMSGVEKQNYLRITLRTEADNDFLFKQCHQIEQEIIQSIQLNDYGVLHR